MGFEYGFCSVFTSLCVPRSRSFDPAVKGSDIVYKIRNNQE